MLAFPGLSRIITQPALYAGRDSLSRKKSEKNLEMERRTWVAECKISAEDSYQLKLCGTPQLVLFGFFPSLCVLLEHCGHQFLRRAKRSLAQATEHSRQVYPSEGGGNIQDRESADNFQVARASRCRAVAFVHQEKTGILFRCESNGISLASVKVYERGIGRRQERHNAQPFARLHRPRADMARRVGIREFGEYGWWDEDASVEPRKHFDGFNQDKIIEWRCIGDDRRHLRPEMAVGLAIAFEVFQAVLQLNAVVLQEGVDFHAGRKAKQTAQLGSGDFAGTVGFERQRFQGSARQVLALRGEGRQELVWKQNGDVLHGLRILEEWRKSTTANRKIGVEIG
jgi:hypothetical protein